MAVEIVRSLEIGAENASGGLLKTLGVIAKEAAPVIAVVAGLFLIYKYATRNRNKTN